MCLARGDGSILYENDFEKAETGKVPADMLVLDGNFSVKADETNKFLELPGAPLDSFSLQFGPAETNSVSVSAVIRSSSKSRRFPTFGVGLYGVAGLKLQVSPAKKALELFKDQTPLVSAPFEWKSGEWTIMQLRARHGAGDTWKVEGKAWAQGDPEPSGWTISTDYKSESPLSGRPSLVGSPFSGMPIQFDNLRVEALKP
jgi:hypothetical protein